MLTYQQAKELLGTARNPENGKPLQRNTRLFKRGDSYAVQLHDTDVVTIHPNNTYTLDTGGWLTLTTKDRINSYGPIGVHQVNRRWYVGRWQWKDKKAKFKSPLFQDGMVVNSKGKVKNPEFLKEEDEKKREKLKRAIKKYVNNFIKDIEINGLKDPSSGDCWDCCMKNEDGKSLGDLHETPDHLISHMRESYFVPSLLYNAIVEARYRPEVYWYMFKEKQCLDRANEMLTKYFYKRLNKLQKIF